MTDASTSAGTATRLRDEANDRVDKKQETKRQNKKTGMLDRLLGIFGKEKKQW